MDHVPIMFFVTGIEAEILATSDFALALAFPSLGTPQDKFGDGRGGFDGIRFFWAAGSKIGPCAHYVFCHRDSGGHSCHFRSAVGDFCASWGGPPHGARTTKNAGTFARYCTSLELHARNSPLRTFVWVLGPRPFDPHGDLGSGTTSDEGTPCRNPLCVGVIGPGASDTDFCAPQCRADPTHAKRIPTLDPLI